MKKRNLLFLVLSIFALLTFSNNANALEIKSKYSDEEIKLNQERATLAGKIEAYFKGLNYPNYFGGIYISDDSRYVVVQIVDNNVLGINENEKSELEKLSKKKEVKLESVKYSYKELERANESLIESISESKFSNDVTAFYIDVENNTVGIDVINDNLTRTQANLKEKMVTSDLFTIRKVKSSTKKYATVFKAGSGFRIYSTTPINDYDCSVGYRAKLGNDYGFITAGHCFNSSSTMTSGVGSVKSNKLSNGIDAAFVKTNSGYSVENKVYASGGKTTKLNTLAVCPFLGKGAIIAKSGRSTGYSEGKVTYATFQAVDNGVVMKHLVGTNANAYFGDSGAPVYIPTTSSSGATLAGVLRGGQPNTDYTMIFTKEDQIAAAIGYSRY